MSIEKLPQWKCHKVVRAAKILGVAEDSDPPRLQLDTVPISDAPIPRGGLSPNGLLPANFIGGYYVVYEDGYTSYSPAEAFEAGYTRLPDGLDGLQPHQQRVVIEAVELADRLEKLTRFLASDFCRTLDGEECDALASQLTAMTEYADCLNLRIARFKA